MQPVKHINSISIKINPIKALMALFGIGWASACTEQSLAIVLLHPTVSILVQWLQQLVS